MLTLSCDIYVCQIWVMTDSEIVTLTQDGAVDFKTIAVFRFLKFDRHPFFIDLSAISFAKRQINHKQNTTMLFLIFKVNLSTSLHSLYQNDGMLPKFVLRDSALSVRPSVHRSVRQTAPTQMIK